MNDLEFEILELKIHTLIKKELFKGPLKPILEKLGGIPVDRKANKDIVEDTIIGLVIKNNLNIH